MKKSNLTLLFFFTVQLALSQITYNSNNVPTGMTIVNPSNSSNSYFNIALNDNLSRAAGGMSIGLDSSFSERFWLYHIYKENNALVRKFHISYSTGTLLTILHDGNVGIGTKNPSKKLEIKGNDGVGIRLFNEAANTWDILNSQYGRLDFVRGGSNVFMRIDQHGNVGIGTKNTGNALLTLQGENTNLLRLENDGLGKEAMLRFRSKSISTRE